MAVPAKTVTAIGLAFAAGVALTVSVMPSKQSPQASSLPSKVPAPVPDRVASADLEGHGTQRAWSDPVRLAPAEAKGASKPVFTNGEVEAAGVRSEPRSMPLPPPRPSIVAESAPEWQRAAPSQRPAPRARIVAKAAPHRAIEAVREAEARRLSPPYPDERREFGPYDSGYRAASLPLRGNDGVDGNAYGHGREAYQDRRAWRPQPDPRAAVRRSASSDGLMRWLAESDRRY